jgi:DNA invertase Pin-like site-specific DNA recombinase
MIQRVRPGDTIIVESFSRISRSTVDLLQLLEQFKNKNIQFISIKQDYDFNTPSGRLIVGVLALFNQFQREMMLDNQAEGIAIAKLKGKYKGRQRIPIPKNFDFALQ